MDLVIFKNKFARYRKENFGGLTSFNSQISLLSKEEYKLLQKIDEKKYILKSSLKKSEIEVCSRLLHHGILLKLDLSRARRILKLSGEK